ncbi:MAG: gliding motility-associated C-terminal domain-containing protein [Bacteroidota bacterium]|nr:gliding motility-associated C-terminal domain-containing protein [Bacteroidota bacterium]
MLKYFGLSLVVFLFPLLSNSQTIFGPGDIVVLGVATDLGNCGFPAESDEISFTCMLDITPGTVITITDNGWEQVNQDFFGNSEGTLTILRALGTIPRGTVLTLRAINAVGGWQYVMVAPDPNFLVTQVNPGGTFNLENGGDQMYFMSGGAWSPGAGNGLGSYSGNIVYGFNTLSTWSTDGSTQQSNLHESLNDCSHMEAPNTDFYKYTNDFSPASKFTWLKRIQDGVNWTTPVDCNDYKNTMPFYEAGYTIPINALTMGISCNNCEGCKPHNDFLTFSLPPGTFNVVYTNGTDFFTLNDIISGWLVIVEEYDDITYSLVSVEEIGGCTWYSGFTGQAEYHVPNHNAGTHGEVWTCPDYGAIYIINYLGNMPEMGGLWAPTIWNNQFYHTTSGEGRWYYIFKYLDPTCPPDSASVDVHFIDPSASTIDVTCDQNGTPNNIFDDRTVFTFTLNGEHVDDETNMYYVTVSSGNITPTVGTAFLPTTFTLDPGTAIGPDVTFTVHLMNNFICEFDFTIPSPGFCSDPCDPDMSSEISGGGDICPNSCPDFPEVITVETFGGTAPYVMDFSLSSPSFPTWTFPGVEISDYHEIQICVGEVPSPVYDEGAASLTIPASLAGHDLLITLDNVFDFYDCSAILNETESFITVHALPFVDTVALSFCSRFANKVDLTDYDLDVNPFLDVTWFDENPFLGGQELFNPQQINLFNVVDLWAQVEDDYCVNAIRVPFIIIPSPDVDSIPPIEICTGGEVVLASIIIMDQSDSIGTYTFHTGFPLDTTTLIDTTILKPADSTEIYLLASFGGCFDTLKIKINIQAFPDFTLQGLPCDIANNTYSVIFTSSADSIIASAGTVVNNPGGNDSVTGIPENTNITIELLNLSSLCRDTFLITAPNCNCPIINPPTAAQGSYSICDDVAIPQMSVTVDPTLVANWYDVPSGGVALVQNSLVYQPVSAFSANYYVEALDPGNSCTSIRTQIPFNVYPVANLQMMADPVICEDASIDFNTLAPGILNGVNGTGSWFRLSNNQSVSGIVVPSNGDAWYYLFTSITGSCLSSDTIVATVNPNPTISAFNVGCVDVSLSYEFSFTTNADDLLASIGLLSQVGTTDTFHLINIPFDTDVVIDLQNSVTGCTNQETISAPNCSCPDLLQQTQLEICSDDANIDLTLYEGFGVTGSWQMASTPPGGNPATLTGNNFNGVNADPGSYMLRFIRSIILNDCVDTSFFEINLHTSVSADAGTDGIVCAPDNIVLSGTAAGSNLQFNWVTSGSGAISNPNALSTTYTPSLNDITSGTMSFTLTANDQTGVCPSASETIDISIDDSAYYILNAPTQVYCDTSDEDIDLDLLITFGTTSGQWFFPDTVNAPVTGSSHINPSTLTAGSYTIFYTSTSAVAPCEDDTSAVSILVENCLCPSVALTAPSGGICEGTTLDLNPLIITPEPGTWSIIIAPVGSNPTITNGTNFSTNQEGSYRLRYTLSNIVVGCPDFSEIQIDVIAVPSLSVSNFGCADDLLSWEATITSDAEVVTVSNGTLTSLGGNQYEVTNITLNTDLQVIASNSNGLCETTLNVPTPDCDCELAISGLPIDVMLCPNETATLTAIVTGGKGSVTSSWTTPNGPSNQNPLVVNQAGTYQYKSEDALGCTAQQTVNVTFYTEMIADATIQHITCPGDNDGMITINGITGGTTPYSLSINAGPSSVINTFPHLLQNLSAGNYKIEITDGTNCKIQIDLRVQLASSESLSLGPDQTILLGDSVTINASLSFVPDTFYWSGDLTLIDSKELDNTISPSGDVTYQLVGIDDKGCTYLDEIVIRVLLHSAIYVPTVFSPNGDGVNDIVRPEADPSVSHVDYFEILSRWGEVVYSATNFDPHTNDGWNGMFNGKPMMPGVFVYRLAAVNKLDQEITQYGNITLIR